MTEAKKTKRRGIAFPLKFKINDRQFTIQHVDTRRLLSLYAEYESLLISVTPDSVAAPPSISSNDADRMVDLTVTLCELCDEDGFGSLLGQFDQRFEPGEQTPFELMQQVAEKLFGPFMIAKKGSRFQPLVERISQPLMNAMSSS